MPNIFDESDPKAVPAAPTGRSVPDFPMGAALAADEAAFEGGSVNVPVAANMTPEPVEEAPVDNAPDWAPPIEETEEKPMGSDATADLMALHASTEEEPAKKAAPKKSAKKTTTKLPGVKAETAPEPVEETPAPEPVVEETPAPEPEPVVEEAPPVTEGAGGSETGEDTIKTDPEPDVEAPAASSVDIEPGAGFERNSGPHEASKAVERLLNALLQSMKTNQSVPRGMIEEYLSPLFDAANRSERVAIKETMQKMQATAVHAMSFNEVISIQHALDFADEKFKSGTRVRKTPEEKAHEKRVKDAREGATVLIAAFELLKSVTPDGVDVTSVARKDSENLIVEAGQHVRWVEGGSVPEQEPKLSPLTKRVLRVFKSAVKGISLEGELKPSVSQVVNVKDEPHKVSTPDEPVREKSARIHVESLFARLQPGQWVSVQQVVDQPSNEYPDKGERPTVAAVKAVLYGEGVEPIAGVEGFTHEGVDGGWKPVEN